MKLTKDTVAKLMLPADKRDVIFFDDEMRGLGYRLRRSPNGQVRASWILQFRAAGRARRYLIGAGDVSAQQLSDAEWMAGQVRRRAPHHSRFVQTLSRTFARRDDRGGI